MPRQLALLLCTAFVLYLLRLERRQSAGVSAASWIPTLWMLAIASKPLGIWFSSAGDAESGSVLDRLFLLGLAAASVAVLAARHFDWAGALRRHGWLVLLMAFMFGSTLWSEIPGIAFRRWIRAVIVLPMAMVVLSEAEPRKAFESLLRRTAYILIPFSLMLIKYYPRLGVEYARWSGNQMWVGVTLHKNTLGRLCVVVAFFLAWVLYRRWRARRSATQAYPWWAEGLVLAVTLYVLRGAENAFSATSVGTLAFGVTFVLAILRLRKLRFAVPRAVLLGFAVFLFGFGAASPFLGGSNLAGFTSSFGRTETLTGRTDTWAELTPVVAGQPLLGEGFGSFWTTQRRDYYRMSHGHNGYLDILLELGAVGLALNAIWLLSCSWRLAGNLADGDGWGALALGYLMMALVYNYTESSLNDPTELFTAIVIFASLVVQHEPVRETSRSHFGVRVHLSPKRDAGTPSPQLGTPADGRAVRVLGGRRGQRCDWPRPRHRGQAPGGTSA